MRRMLPDPRRLSLPTRKTWDAEAKPKRSARNPPARASTPATPPLTAVTTPISVP